MELNLVRVLDGQWRRRSHLSVVNRTGDERAAGIFLGDHPNGRRIGSFFLTCEMGWPNLVLIK